MGTDRSGLRHEDVRRVGRRTRSRDQRLLGISTPSRVELAGSSQGQVVLPPARVGRFPSHVLSADLRSGVESASCMSEIADLVPQEGFLADYVAYARRHAMAPDQFHLACGLGALSAIAGSALWFPMGISRYYGTFWGVLCGPAGRARKTSAMKLAMDLVDSVIPELQLPSDFSREALLQLLEKQPSGVMMIDEFGGFLARASRDYMSGVKQDLSKMWDS